METVTPVTTVEGTSARLRLLHAAERTFAAKGYDGASTRQIAREAGLDAALIARYFGNKEGLYLAVIEAGRSSLSFDDGPIAPDVIARTLLVRWLQSGGSPIAAYVVRPQGGQRVGSRIHRLLQRRFLGPLTGALAEVDDNRAALKADIVAAALAGIALAKAAGSLPRLSKAPDDEVLLAVQEMLTLDRSDRT